MNPAVIDLRRASAGVISSAVRVLALIIPVVLLAGTGLRSDAQPTDARRALAESTGATPTTPRGRSNSEFRVATHGFAFRNSFDGSPLPASLREAKSGWEKTLKGVLDKNVELPRNFGLCGGMCLAAADFFHAGLAIPRVDAPPQAGTPLYEYLYQRQVESWGTASVYALKFLRWMRLPDAGADSPSERSVAEIKMIATKVSAGELVPVGLVLVRHAEAGARNGGKPWENHQVLCWKVEPRADGSARGGAVGGGASGGVDLHVYDPNYPKDEGVVVRVSNATSDGKKPAPDKPVTLARLTSKGKATVVRGVFAMPYERKDVPEGVANERMDNEATDK